MRGISRDFYVTPNLPKAVLGRIARGCTLPGMSDGDPIAAQLRALHDQRQRERALRCPRVQRGAQGRYFLASCPQCDEETYQHLDGGPGAPTGAVRLSLAWCEECGCFTSWQTLDGLGDGSVRVLGPDFGADGAPTPSKPPQGGT